MSKVFTGFNRSEKLLILENRLMDFDLRFKRWNEKRLAIPEHVYRDFCYNKQEYLEEIENVVEECRFWVESVGVFAIGGS